MVTSVVFVGLMILVNYGPTSAELIVGAVPGMMPMHDAVIVYNEDELASQENWPPAGRVIIGGECYAYVELSQENISLTGSESPFKPQVEEMFHLSCCCAAMTGIRTEYGDSSLIPPAKAAAHVTINHGIYSDFTMSSGAKGTQVIFEDNPQLTVVGELAGRPTKRLTFKPGAVVWMANTPLAALSGYALWPASHDFQAFYNTGTSAGLCRYVPTDPLPNPCTLTKAPCKGNGVPKVKLTPAQQKVLDQANARLHSLGLVTDINCSGSAWP